MAQPGNETPREQWGTSRRDEHCTDFARPARPWSYQLGAWALWLAGFAAAFGGMLCASGSVDVPVLSGAPVVAAVLGVAVDLAAVLAAQGLWKRAGALVPGRKQGVLGIAMACLAFAPMALFFLVAKNAPARTRVAASAAALASIGILVAGCWLLAPH